MRAEEFTTHIRRLMPGKDELSARGLDDGEASAIQEVFMVPSQGIDDRGHHLDELVRLVTLFDCSKLQISRVEFEAGARQLPWGLQVAHEEADPIVVAQDGGVLLLDHAAAGAVLHRCARDGAGFLSALAFAATATRNRASWRGRLDDLSLECSMRAGSPEYRPYYLGLCAFAAGP